MTKFKLATSEGENLREKYKKLVEHMPLCAIDKLGDLGSPQACFNAITNLTRKHSGELVAIDLTRDNWRLLQVPPGFARMQWGEQFWCFEGGVKMNKAWDEQTRKRESQQWSSLPDGSESINQIMSVEQQKLGIQRLAAGWG